MARTYDGAGYWLLTSAGQVFAYGDARQLGDVSTISLPAPAVGLASNPGEQGYLIILANGQAARFGAGPPSANPIGTTATPPPTSAPATSPPATTPTVPTFVYTGTGNTVIQNITKPDPWTVVTMTYSGGSNFIVVPLDSDLHWSGLSLVNTIGSYAGTVGLDFDPYLGTTTTNLQVTASGPWRIELKPLSTAPVITATAAGHGDMVLQNLIPGNHVAHFTHDGHSNFIVLGFDDSGHEDFMVNEIGQYDGSTPWRQSRAVTIRADGNWTVSVS
jgi:hypothetical protein